MLLYALDEFFVSLLPRYRGFHMLQSIVPLKPIVRLPSNAKAIS